MRLSCHLFSSKNRYSFLEVQTSCPAKYDGYRYARDMI
jgi:hypothetical protein